MNAKNAGGQKLPRRRLLTLLAATAAMSGLPGSTPAAAPVFEWCGTALGGRVRMLFACDSELIVTRAIARAVAEIERLEAIFSLYRGDSELSRLNNAGRLMAPSLDMVELLTESIRLGNLSGGAFDISVQPLWTLYRDHFADTRNDPDGPAPRAISAVRRLVDYRQIEVTAAQIAFARPGMAMTLNGIAQGYLTDRVSDLLRGSGFAHVLVDLGEIRANGHPPGAGGWPVDIAFPQPSSSMVTQLLLRDRSIATSAGATSAFDASGRHHHIFDPATGLSARRFKGVSVIARRATLADGLSTALSVMNAERGAALLDRFGDAEAYWLTESETLSHHRSLA